MSSLILRLESLGRAPDHDVASSATTSITRTLRPVVDVSDRGASMHPLARWRAAVHSSRDACLVLDAEGTVVSLSSAAAEALGCEDVTVLGRPLLDVIDVVDLDTGASNPEYATRITPLATLGGRGLMRSLMRVRHPDGSLATVDSTSAPLHDDTGETLGSVSFFATFATL